MKHITQIITGNRYTVPTNQYTISLNRQCILNCVGKIHRDDLPPSKIAYYKECLNYFCERNKELEAKTCI